MIKLEKGYWVLTEEGIRVIENKEHALLYLKLLLFFITDFDWISLNQIDGFELIQNSCIFNLHIVHKKADKFIEDNELSEIFLKAFPQLVPEKKHLTEDYNLVRSLAKSCFNFRFLKCFCTFFGLLEEQIEKDPQKKSLVNKSFYKKTAFFDKLLIWGI